MIQGDGFFVVQKGAESLYTRAGAFTFDETGTLVTPTGNRVQGYALDAAGDADRRPRSTSRSTPRSPARPCPPASS